MASRVTHTEESSKSPYSEEPTKSGVQKQPTVVVDKELHALIGTVKEMGLFTTYEEVLEGLRIYIIKKKLFDEHNPIKVCCKDDELGSVLGIEEFKVSDLKHVLQRITMPLKAFKNSVIKDPAVIKSAEAASLQSENPLKRKLDESLESDKKRQFPDDAKKLSSSPLVVHIPPSPNYIDESDSIDSVQGYETAIVKDTSDDLLSADEILAVEETYNIEYEVESDSSFDDPTLSDDSSDSKGDRNPESMMLLNAAIMTFLSKPESDIEFFADDSSENDSDIDAEITESDFWTCKKCKVANKPPMRYCLKCFNERLNWLPDSERNKRNKRNKRKPCKRTCEASSSKTDQSSSQGSNSSTISCETKQTVTDPSSSLGSATESVSSPYMTSTDLPGTESSDLPSTQESVLMSCMDTAGLSSVNTDLGSPCVETKISHYFKPAGPYIMNIADDSDPCSIEPKSSFCMKSMDTFFDGLKNMQSLGSSSIESSSATSLDSLYPSSMKSSDSSSLECLSSAKYSNCSSMEACSSSMNSSGMKHVVPSGTKPSCSSNTEPGAKLCIICCASPALASIIHGKFAHQVTCYKCARKIQKEKFGCPICRLPIERVVHQINNL